jgi:hypothetical protein
MNWRFLADDAGAVTVDWVVMTSAVVGLGLASATQVAGGVSNLGEAIHDILSNTRVAGRKAGEPLIAFDFNDVTGLTRTGWGWVTWGSYQGWTAVGPVQQIEIVESGHRGVHSPDGGNWIDLDASPGNLTLTRGLESLNTGAIYTLSFNAASSHANNGVEVWFGGQLVGQVSPTSRNFSPHSLELIGGSGDGTNRLEFRGTGTPDGYGVSLHGVRID